MTKLQKACQEATNTAMREVGKDAVVITIVRSTAASADGLAVCTNIPNDRRATLDILGEAMRALSNDNPNASRIVVPQ